jgi:hypothetical protein
VLTVSNDQNCHKKLENAHGTFRNGHLSGQERLGLRVGTQQRFGPKSGKRSRSRFKNERIIV